MDHHWQAYSLECLVRIRHVYIKWCRLLFQRLHNKGVVSEKQDLTGIFCHLPWLIDSNSPKKNPQNSPESRGTESASRADTWKPEKPFQDAENKSLGKKMKDGIRFWDSVLTTSKPEDLKKNWPFTSPPFFKSQCRCGHRHFVFQIHSYYLHLLYCQEHGSHHPRAKAQVKDWCRWTGDPGEDWRHKMCEFLPYGTFTNPSILEFKRKKTLCNNPTYIISEFTAKNTTSPWLLEQKEIIHEILWCLKKKKIPG